MTTTIYVCSNRETLADGYVADSEFYAEAIADAVGEVCRMIDDAGRDCVSEPAAHYQDWHGGKYYKAGGMVAGQPWGYSAGFAVVTDREVPQAVRDLCDRANALLCERLTAIGAEEDAQHVAE